MTKIRRDQFDNRSRAIAGGAMIGHADNLAAMLRRMADDVTVSVIEADKEAFDGNEGWRYLQTLELLRQAAERAYVLGHELSGIDVSAELRAVLPPPAEFGGCIGPVDEGAPF